MPKALRWVKYGELGALFLLQYMALGIWFVPLSTVLDAHHLQSIRPYAFAASALAAFVSPLIFGAMCDRHASPAKVLRGLCLASAAALLLVVWSLESGWPAGVVLLLIQLYALCASPTGSITAAIVFAPGKLPVGIWPGLGLRHFWLDGRLLAGQRPEGGHVHAGRGDRRGGLAGAGRIHFPSARVEPPVPVPDG